MYPVSASRVFMVSMYMSQVLHVIRENPRKLLQLDTVLDYDNAGPNTKHDPRGKKGGSSGNHP